MLIFLWGSYNYQLLSKFLESLNEFDLESKSNMLICYIHFNFDRRLFVYRFINFKFPRIICKVRTVYNPLKDMIQMIWNPPTRSQKYIGWIIKSFIYHFVYLVKFFRKVPSDTYNSPCFSVFNCFCSFLDVLIIHWDENRFYLTWMKMIYMVL